MGFRLAFTLCVAGVAGLFWLDRDQSIRTSKALWLPVIWLWIMGSRPLSAWLQIWVGFGPQPSGAGLDAQLDGSPTDAAVLAALLAIGLVVLYRRGNRTVAFLKASVPVLIYFGYCLASVSWSPFPDVAFKRWIKSVGDLAMVLIVLTEGDATTALHRVISRVGFILLPASVLLARYAEAGHAIDDYGNFTITGVTTNKNTLGLITFVLALGALWNFRARFRPRRQPNRRRHLLAQGTLLAFGLAVLGMANSATSISCFIIGGGLMILTGLGWVGRRPSRMHTVVLGVAIIAGVAMASGANEAIVHALGRQPDLTGRTEIWKTVIPMARDPIIGAGFESFWNASSANLKHFTGAQSQMFNNLVSAHNGYIDVYLNLGWVGVCLIALILITGYLRAGAAFRRDPVVGGLILTYIVTAAIYSVTEAGFRMLTPSWIFLLWAVVAAGGANAGIVRSGAPRISSARASQLAGESSSIELGLPGQPETEEPIGKLIPRIGIP